MKFSNYTATIQALGKLGIPMCCYNFMAGIGWYRTAFDIPERGGSLTSEFDYQDAEKEGLTEWGKVCEEENMGEYHLFPGAGLSLLPKKQT